MLYIFDRTRISAIYCILVAALLCTMLSSVALATGDGTIERALNAAIPEKGPFYQWTLAEKAAFYDQYVYDGLGTRRGVPDERHISPEVMKVIAPALLAVCLGCDQAELSHYTIDMDFWVDAFLDDADREHEFYSVCFLLVDSAFEKPHNVYQLQISAYTGELVEAINLETGWTWCSTATGDMMAE